MASKDEVEAEAARPMPWFRHDADSSQDIKCKRLLRRLGMAGYGRWWRLCEIMASTTCHAPTVEDAEDAEILAEELQFDSIDELADFLRVLADIGLVEMPGDGTFYSLRMLKEAEVFGTNRVNGRRGGRPRAKTGKTAVKTDH